MPPTVPCCQLTYISTRCCQLVCIEYVFTRPFGLYNIQPSTISQWSSGCLSFLVLGKKPPSHKIPYARATICPPDFPLLRAEDCYPLPHMSGDIGTISNNPRITFQRNVEFIMPTVFKIWLLYFWFIFKATLWTHMSWDHINRLGHCFVSKVWAETTCKN